MGEDELSRFIGVNRQVAGQPLHLGLIDASAVISIVQNDEMVTTLIEAVICRPDNTFVGLAGAAAANIMVARDGIDPQAGGIDKVPIEGQLVAAPLPGNISSVDHEIGAPLLG